MIYQIAYVSTAAAGPAADALPQILSASRRNNAYAGITGLLIYHDRTFFQVLEGRQEAVEGCLDRIRADRRHGETLIVWEDCPEQRSFADWSMACAAPDDLCAEARAGVLSLNALRSGGAGPAGTGDASTSALIDSILNDILGRRSAPQHA